MWHIFNPEDVFYDFVNLKPTAKCADSLISFLKKSKIF